MSMTEIAAKDQKQTFKDPAHVVQEQLDAFNARDAERFASCYSTDAVMTDGAGNVIAQGRDAIGKLWGKAMEDSPDLHAEVSARIHIGSWVIDDDHTTNCNLEGFPSEMRFPVAYQVEGGKIVRCMALM
jgi:putative hydrolase of HD superfamily